MLTTHLLLTAEGRVQARSNELPLPALEGWLSRAVRNFGQRQVRAPEGLRVSLVRLQGQDQHFLATIQVPEDERLDSLTQRERQVAEFASAGATSPEVAGTLGISTHTVRQHLKEVYRKLGVASRFELRDRMAG